MRALVDYIDRYRPGFSEEIVPAVEADIEMLEWLAGSLPGAYQRFLRTMGASMGNLVLGEANFKIKAIKGTHHAFPWLKRERYRLVAADEGLADLYYFLDIAKPHGGDDCMVVRMPLEETFDPGRHIPEHVGLEEFLYYEAAKSVRLPLLPWVATFSMPEDPLSKARSAENIIGLAEEAGFTRVPPADRCAVYERGDAALLLYQHPTEARFSVTLGCEEPGLLDELSRELTARVGVVRDR